MANQYKVGFLGIKAGATRSENLIGLRIYTLTLDKIIDIVQNHGPKGELSDIQFDLIPERECHVMCSGRDYPFSSRIEVLEVINNIDILIISACTEFVYARGFLIWLTPDVLPKSCIIVLRLPFPHETERPFLTYHAREWLGDMGLTVKGEINEKKKTSNKNKEKRELFIIGLEEYGGIIPEVSIPLLESSLLKEEVKDEITKPVNETADAGRSLFNYVTKWMSNLVKRT